MSNLITVASRVFQDILIRCEDGTSYIIQGINNAAASTGSWVMTGEIPEEHFSKWLDDHKDTKMVLNQLIMRESDVPKDEDEVLKNDQFYRPNADEPVEVDVANNAAKIYARKSGEPSALATDDPNSPKTIGDHNDLDSDGEQAASSVKGIQSVSKSPDTQQPAPLPATSTNSSVEAKEQVEVDNMTKKVNDKLAKEK